MTWNINWTDLGIRKILVLTIHSYYSVPTSNFRTSFSCRGATQYFKWLFQTSISWLASNEKFSSTVLTHSFNGDRKLYVCQGWWRGYVGKNQDCCSYQLLPFCKISEIEPVSHIRPFCGPNHGINNEIDGSEASVYYEYFIISEVYKNRSKWT